MVYVALLRGINVGGKNTVPMKELKQLFIDLGYMNVMTLLNTGNVVFRAETQPEASLITQAIHDTFGLPIECLILSKAQLSKVVDALPESWVTDNVSRTEIMFYLQSDLTLPDTNACDTIIETPHALIWHIKRVDYGKSRLNKIIGTHFYKNSTMRNANTVRKLYNLMQ